MKEYGPGGFNPQEKLTPQAQKPYAESGGFIMPEGGEGPRSQDTIITIPHEQQSQEEVNPPTPLELAQMRRVRAFEREYGRLPQNIDEMQVITMAAEEDLKQEGKKQVDTNHLNREQPQFSQRESIQAPTPIHRNREEQRRTSETSANGPVSSGRVIAEDGEVLIEEGLKEVEELERRYTAGTDFSNNEEYTGNDQSVLRPNGSMRQFLSEYPTISGGDHENSDRTQKKKELDAIAEARRRDWYLKDKNGNYILQQKDVDGARVEVKVRNPVSWTRSRAFLNPEILAGMEETMYGLKINSVEALAVEIMDTDKTSIFQVGAEYQLLDENGEFQPDNFLHWVRSWMMHWHSEDPEGKWEFGKIIGLHTDYNSISVDNLVQRAGRYFRSADPNNPGEDGEGKVYSELVEQIKREIWLFTTSRTFDITYKENMGSDENLAKTLNQLFFTNTFTKSVWNQRSALYWMSNIPQHFKERKSMKGEKQDDGNIGEALVTAYLAYYNISDAEVLKELFGEDTALLDKDAILKAIDKQMVEEHIPFELRDKYIADSDMKALLDKDENVLNFVNIFNQPQKNSRIVKVVRGLIQQELARKYHMTYIDDDDIDPKTGQGKEKVDEISVSYADTFALSMARWTGAASRNDTTAVGYDAWLKFQDTEHYREKQVADSRIGAYGAPYTVHHLKQLGLDLPTGIKALNDKTLLDIFKNIQEVSQNKDKTYIDYEHAASQLVFADNTMRSFTVDHFNRIFAVYSQVMDSESIDFDKFTKFDLYNGLTFDRGQFEKAVKENFFKPMRYAWATYKGIDYSQRVRKLVDSKKLKYKEMYLAEAMFGREILDIPPLWNKGKEHIKMTDENWDEKINWEIINTDTVRKLLWHRAALLRIAAELYAHRDRHNNETRYDFRYYEQILMAIDSLPSQVDGDETDMKASKAFGSAFTEEEKKWLRNISKTGRMRLMMGGIGHGLATEGLKGVKDAAGAFMKGIAA